MWRPYTFAVSPEEISPPVQPLASDLDRDRAVESLSSACTDGRLRLEEFSSRVERALAARTRTELGTLTADLGDSRAVAAILPARRASWALSVMSSTLHGGRWRMASSLRALAVMGDCTIDLRQADVEAQESHVLAACVMGTVRVIVPEGIDVYLDGLAVMGTRQLRGGSTRSLPGSPRIRVTAAAIMGEVQVVVEAPVGPLGGSPALPPSP